MKNLYTAAIFFLGICAAQAQVFDVGSYAQMTDVSDSGMAVGNVANAFHVKWTEQAGAQGIGELTSGDFISGYTNVSNDGKYISGTMTNEATGLDEMARYEVATEAWTFLGGLKASSDATVSSAWGMTSDGNTVVGLGYPTGSVGHGIKWTQQGGIVDLGSTVPNRSSRANAINDDGTVIVGWQDNDYGDRQGVYWLNGEQVHLKTDGGGYTGEAVSVTPDGKTIIGFTEGQPFIWNATAGYITITHPDPDFVGAAASITNDGKTVVGYFRPWNGQAVMGEGFIYTPEKGRVDLNEYVASLGMDNLGITFALPMAISPNGRYITGIGRTDNDLRGFVIKLPADLSTTETAAKTKYAVYPNPVKDRLFIKNTAGITHAELYNMAGQKVLSSQNVTKDGIDVSKLAKGNYVLKVTSPNHTETVKVLKN